MIRRPEEQRAEEQLRRLIGDAAYTVWEETGRIHMESKIGECRAMTSVWYQRITVGEAGPAVPHWSIRRPRSPANPVTLWYTWYTREGSMSTYHCAGAAWGFKGSIPMADQVIALCLWLHADEEAVICKAFPRVRSLPRTHRAEHWDAIVAGASS